MSITLELSEGEARWLAWFLTNGSGTTKKLREDLAASIKEQLDSIGGR